VYGESPKAPSSVFVQWDNGETLMMTEDDQLMVAIEATASSLMFIAALTDYLVEPFFPQSSSPMAPCKSPWKPSSPPS
jgi:hypothetical protein